MIILSQLLRRLATVVGKSKWTLPANRRMPTAVIPINYHKVPFLAPATGETRHKKSWIIARPAEALDLGVSTGEAVSTGPTCSGVGEARSQWRYRPNSGTRPVARAHRLTDDDQATGHARPISEP